MTVIAIIAGEPSGDVLGAELMAALVAARQETDLTFVGVGGPAMEQAGLQSFFPLTDITHMGLSEILPHLATIVRRIRQCAQAVRAHNPDVIITIDAPDFSRRVIRQLQDLPCPKVHYVAPSVWAWRPGRAKTFAKLYTHMMALLPFEPPWFEAVGLPCTFVGHPAICRKTPLKPSTTETTILVLPGSRSGELRRMIPVFIQTLERILATEKVRVVIPTFEHLVPQIQRQSWPCPIHIATGHARTEAFQHADVALAASGTVALELAVHGIPAVIGYRVAPVGAFIFRQMSSLRSACLVNILLNKTVIPEHIQSACTPERLAADLVRLLQPEAGQAQISEAQKALALLEPGGGGGSGDGKTPSEAAAAVVLGTLERSPARK